MPALVTGNPYSKAPSFEDSSISYDYPNGVNLKPGSTVHEKLRLEVFNKAQQSYQAISKRFDSWNQIDNTLVVYMPTDEAEDALKKKDERKPVSIVVPYSYAQLETIVTYMVAAFCQDPIFRYEGTGPEDTIGATLLELLVQSQCNRFKLGIALHTMFRDCCAYGIGAIAPYWQQVWGKKVVKDNGSIFDLFGREVGNKRETRIEDALLYEGNNVSNIDPYRFMPDPNYGIQDIQKGDFVGWIDTKSLMDLINLERKDEDYFNVKYLKFLSSRRSALFRFDDSRRDPHGTTRDRWAVSEQYSKPTDMINMVMKIIPREFNLPGDAGNPNGEYSEKWLFTLAADQVIIRAKPLGLNHDMYPVVVGAPDFDGRSITPISRLETIYGLQETLNFMFNSHVANVRKAVNDMLVVDPYLVNMNDLKDPQPGKLIRLRRSAWGHGTKDVVTQLKVTDVTANNINDGNQIMSIMERVSGATYNMMGIMRPGSERRSATEFEGTQNSALNRLERMASMIGLQAMQDLGYMMGSQTQQLMSQETAIKITGQWEKTLRKEYGDQVKNSRLTISPYDIAIDYDCKVRDGSVPGGNFSQAWVQMFQSIGSSPILASRLDVFRIFMHIARSLGAKDIEQFELTPNKSGSNQPAEQFPQVQASVLPNEEVQRQAQAGNIVPIGA
jgi:hypothetical protein